jgi:hypothetical protein
MIFDNENILGLIYNSYANYHNRQLLDKMFNKTISKIILSKRKTFNSIYKTIGKNNKVYITHNNSILFFASLPNNSLIITTNDKKLNLWSLENYQCIKLIEQEDNITSLIVLPNYKLITTTDDSFIKARSINKDFKTTASLHLEGYSGLSNLLFLSNGKIACSAVHSNSYPIIILDYSNEKITYIKHLLGHDSWITRIINLSENGFAFSSEDGTFIIWQAGNDYYKLHGIDEHDDIVCEMLFIEDENLLITGSFHVILDIGIF